MKIAIQGELGSFHHEAAMRLEPRADIISERDFASVFEAVSEGRTDYGLCAVENNLYGSINEVYRLQERYDVWIVRDLRMRIAQQLIGPQAISVQELAAADDVRVLTQAPAFAQVELWLDVNLPSAVREEMSDTALSVHEVMQRGQPHTVAVAGAFAAKTYNGVIVRKDIQDEADNYTRFILFQKERQDVLGATHASMIFKTDHTPGALLRALQVFADHDCNLMKLDSHPIPSDRRRYAFYADYELSAQGVSAVIVAELQRQGCLVRALGEFISE
jgi:prephenate dehydratase